MTVLEIPRGRGLVAARPSDEGGIRWPYSTKRPVRQPRETLGLTSRLSRRFRGPN